MKIAILSLKLHTNYGGILQAYALQTLLQKQGHEVEILSGSNLMPSLKWYKKPLCYGKRALLKLLKEKNTPIYYEKKYNEEYAILSRNTNEFVKTYLNVRYIKSFHEIKDSDYDVYVVGSDQVWRKRYFCSPWNAEITNAFLEFAKGWNVKRVAYAASFGVDEWEFSEKETLVCSSLVKQFDKVSVREASGVDLCRKYLGVEAAHVLDPTLLLDKKEYEDLLISESPSAGSLLNYILDEDKEKMALIERIAKERNLEPFSLNKTYLLGKSSNSKVEPKIRIQSWLRGFYDAKFVVTDSFHACIFSIIFKKPFVVVMNNKRGATRFSSLLSLFGLEKNILYSPAEYDPESDYSVSEEILQKVGKMVTMSKEYLRIV